MLWFTPPVILSAAKDLILDVALINRTTFYRHYDSKYDLADKMAAGFPARFGAALESAR